MTRHGGQTDLVIGALIGLYKGTCMSGGGICETWHLRENTGHQVEATHYAKNQLAAVIRQIEKNQGEYSK